MPQGIALFASLYFLLCACVGPAFGLLIETAHEHTSAEATLAGRLPSEPGAWRSKTQQVFDPVARTLVRRSYTIWDPEPSRNSDFAWVPDVVEGERDGPVNGAGRLIWRIRGKPAYDPDAVFAEFQGVMKDGRPEGRGKYTEHTGLQYDGDWQNGTMEGRGRLKLPTMDEYFGEFRAGKASGIGRYVDVTGETFEGSFVNGLRDGRGTTRLPSGLSYRSTWLAGEETPEFRAVRVSQAGPQRMPAPADEVRVGVEAKGVYESSSAGSVLSIRPYEMQFKAWKGDGDLSEAFVLEDGGGRSDLELRIAVQNRSPRQLQISGFSLDVQSSMTDLQPAIFAKVGRKNDCGHHFYRPVIVFQNFGWGDAEEAVYRFSFVPVVPPLETPRRIEQPALSKRLGRIDRTVTLDLEPELRAAGVDTNLFGSRANGLVPCQGRDENVCLAELKRSGALGSLAQLINARADQELELAVDAVGTLEYTWTDHKGDKKRRISPLKARMQLGHFRRPNSACAEMANPETLKTPVSLELDQANYRVSLPVPPRPVPAGRTYTLNFAVMVAKSSQHEFRVVVDMADGTQVTSRPIRLMYYAPRK